VPPRWQTAHGGCRRRRRGATNSASARSREIAGKAASISRLLLALRTWICSPKSPAVFCTVRKVVSAVATLLGFDRHGDASGFGSARCGPQPNCCKLCSNTMKRAFPSGRSPCCARAASGRCCAAPAPFRCRAARLGNWPRVKSGTVSPAGDPFSEP
jgi:hypothetical protein